MIITELHWKQNGTLKKGTGITLGGSCCKIHGLLRPMWLGSHCTLQPPRLLRLLPGTWTGCMALVSRKIFVFFCNFNSIITKFTWSGRFDSAFWHSTCLLGFLLSCAHHRPSYALPESGRNRGNFSFPWGWPRKIYYVRSPGQQCHLDSKFLAAAQILAQRSPNKMPQKTTQQPVTQKLRSLLLWRKPHANNLYTWWLKLFHLPRTLPIKTYFLNLFSVHFPRGLKRDCTFKMVTIFHTI